MAIGKCVTQARVLFPTFAHGNRQNETRQRNRGRRPTEKREYGKK